jgi:antitoxin VapB
MATARVIRSGKSHAVLLPKEYRIRTKEVEIYRWGNEIVLREKFTGLEEAYWLIRDMEGLDELVPRRNYKPQKRKRL